MDHNEVKNLIHPYVDGELDAANAHEVARHIDTCAECRSSAERIRSMRTALTGASPAFQAPARLRKDIRAALRREARAESDTSSRWLQFLFPATALALLLIGFVLFQNSGASRNAIVDEVIANHVRSLLATHLVDVPSSDQHTVKPWFNGKIDFAPEVRDFSADGFPLVGGRLDYLDGKTVAALVYRRNQHPINVLIAPAPGKRDVPPSMLTRRGYNVVHWTRNEMNYWAVSDLNTEELAALASRLSG